MFLTSLHMYVLYVSWNVFTIKVKKLYIKKVQITKTQDKLQANVDLVLKNLQIKRTENGDITYLYNIQAFLKMVSFLLMVFGATPPKNMDFRNEMFRQIDDQSLFTV